MPPSELSRARGGLDQAIEITPLGSGYPERIAFEWEQTETPEGRSAYWVRAAQKDGVTTWSSPVFVHRRSR